ncbi:MAG: hypothetical protein AB4372_36910 [Xenococcus sp. (in: cyanobacteria)]
MKILTASSLVVSALLLGLSQTPARGFTLDTFTDGDQFISVKDGSTSDSVTGITGTDFGNRTIELDMTSGRGSIEIDLTPQDAIVSANGSAQMNFSKFTWGSDTATPQNFKDISGHDSLAVEILSIDLIEGATFSFTVTDSKITPETATVSSNLNSLGTHYFRYSDFEADNSNIDLNSIEKVELTVSGMPPAFDTTFDFIQSAQAVPFEFSPTLGIIIAGSFIGFNILKKRAKIKKI